MAHQTPEASFREGNRGLCTRQVLSSTRARYSQLAMKDTETAESDSAIRRISAKAPIEIRLPVG